MNARSAMSRPSRLILIAALLVLLGTLGFAAVRPDYHHVTQTISELGAFGSARFRLVGLGVFLPSGLLVWQALWQAHRLDTAADTTRALVALSSLGLGYVGAAIFPCDPGSPLWGTARQQVHNLVGASEYLGCGAGFLSMGHRALRDRRGAHAVLWVCSGLLAWLGLVLLGRGSLFGVRGAIQRVTEAVLFVGTYGAVLSIERRARS